MEDFIEILLGIYTKEVFLKNMLALSIMVDAARSDGLITYEEWAAWESFSHCYPEKVREIYQKFIS